MRRSLDDVFVHLVWATWDRAPLLSETIRNEAYRLIGATCADMGISVVALGGVTDHVHLLVRLPATISVAELVKAAKGSSGHALARHAIANGEFFKWQGSYGAFSVSPHEVDRVARYIHHQEAHHARRDLMPQWELPATTSE